MKSIMKKCMLVLILLAAALFMQRPQQALAATGKGAEEETETQVAAAAKIPLKAATLKYPSLLYNGKARTQSGTTVVTAVKKGKTVTLKWKTDYTISYKNNVNAGTATMIIKGKGDYSGTLTKTFQIRPVKLSSATLKYASLSYTGKARTQSSYTVVKAKVAGKLTTLTWKQDYSCSYKDNVEPGTATMTIRGKGNFTGTLKKTFTIKPPALKLTLEHYSRTSGDTNPVKSGATLNMDGKLYISSNHNIVSVTTSNKRIAHVSTDTARSLKQYGGTYATVLLFDVGKVTLTVKDIYGQTKKLTFQVKYKLWEGVAKSAGDASLPVPGLDYVEYQRLYIGVNTRWPDSFPENGKYGFQGMISHDDAFYDDRELSYTDDNWNDCGYGHVSWFYTAGDYYVRLRSYRIEGSTVYYSGWSEPMQIRSLNETKKLSGKAQYSYSLYYLDACPTYSELDRPVYLKTNNPDRNTIKIVSGGENALRSISIMGEGRYYDDVTYTGFADNDALLQKVKGGYIGHMQFDTAGTHTVEIRELTSGGYYTAKTVKIEVLDYEAERDAYMDKIIKEHTTSKMNPLQKMQAIEKYFNNESGFMYLTNVDEDKVQLAAQPNTPWFKTKRWDSATSPSMLQVFAGKIGGLTNIHGGTDWSTHAYAFATYDGKEYAFCVCPSMRTGDVSGYKKINFSDTASLYAAK